MPPFAFQVAKNERVFVLEALLKTVPEDQLAALRETYASPPRAYHHFGHVEDVLRHYADVLRDDGWRHPREALFAVLYHDAVYVPGRSDNEAASARLAEDHLRRWPRPDGLDVARIAASILLTARHGALSPEDIEDEDTRRFLDCDMAILGAAPEVFAAYDRAIAEEYRSVPRWLYRIKRRQFFRRLLAQPRIFLSDLFRDRYEAQARRNLAAALDGD